MCACIFAIGAFVSVFFSTALHGVFTREMTTFEFMGFFECIGRMAASKQHFMLYLLCVGFSFVMSAVFFLTNMRPYHSHLNKVTPDIHTPAAVGQYQHGSAKWLTDKEKEKAFESLILDPNDAQIKELLKTGYDGLDFLKK